MKITKKGNVKLEKGDFRVDNYVFHEEKGFIKVCDINSLVSWRINNLLVGSGVFLKQILELARGNDENAIAFLRMYAVAGNLFLSVVPDIQKGADGGEDKFFLLEIIDLCNQCVKRHPEVYGMESNPSDEKNESDLQNVKDMENLKGELIAKAEEFENKK